MTVVGVHDASHEGAERHQVLQLQVAHTTAGGTLSAVDRVAFGERVPIGRSLLERLQNDAVVVDRASDLVGGIGIGEALQPRQHLVFVGVEALEAGEHTPDHIPGPADADDALSLRLIFQRVVNAVGRVVKERATLREGPLALVDRRMLVPAVAETVRLLQDVLNFVAGLLDFGSQQVVAVDEEDIEVF